MREDPGSAARAYCDLLGLPEAAAAFQRLGLAVVPDPENAVQERRQERSTTTTRRSQTLVWVGPVSIRPSSILKKR